MSTMIDEKNSKYRICPYLGQRTDPETALSYPSDLNYCIHSKPMAAIELDHQEEFCLTSGYKNCDEYRSTPDAPLPAGLHTSAKSLSRRSRGIGKWIWGIIVISLVIIAAWQVTSHLKDINQIIVIPTKIMVITETSTEIASNVLAPTSTPTIAPTFVGTATTRPFLGLDIPLGIDHKFAIVQIQAGDSLDRIANKHGTTVTALLACNYRIPSPLTQGWAIIVPINFVDMQGIPAFEAYHVAEVISMKDLATLLSVDLNEFTYYNALDENFISGPGDWLLVPRIGMVAPTP
jgi:hypothetical protein